ncbi:hypothetical protein V1264_004745 [Littorina saxatilis]|uniref:Phospholipase A2-like central domain-containing protein n=2 Tax=Littorina saxatilis TaxID=31220 RepID=A0AAN9B2B2_9CAEN
MRTMTKGVICLMILCGIFLLNLAANTTGQNLYLKVTTVKDDITQVEVTAGGRYLVSVSQPSKGDTICYADQQTNQDTDQENGDVNQDDVTSVSTIIAELKADPATISKFVDNSIIDAMFRYCDSRPEEVALLLSELTNAVAPPDQTGVAASKRAAKRALGWLIYTGTKWCGAGNIADNATDIGTLEETDTCCRAHDQCDVTIDSWNYKYGMFNWSFFRVSHCACDRDFKQCLKKVTSEDERPVARTIKNIYFNLLDLDCFVFDSDGNAVMKS